MAQIICQDLSLGYQGMTVAEHVDFTVTAGDYLCIVGANGAGKSTLMKALLNFHKPLGGRIIFGDGCSPRDIGYLSQQTEVQRDFPASVREIVQSGCQGRLGFAPFYSKEDKQLAVDNMMRLGIEDLANRCFRDLSGGQKQRVLLARALCSAQKMLLLDEPTNGLDPQVTADMYQILAELNRSGITIIMVTHDLTDALPYATHILHLGRHNFWGTREEYINNPEFKNDLTKERA